MLSEELFPRNVSLKTVELRHNQLADISLLLHYTKLIALNVNDNVIRHLPPGVCFLLFFQTPTNMLTFKTCLHGKRCSFCTFVTIA